MRYANAPPRKETIDVCTEAEWVPCFKAAVLHGAEVHISIPPQQTCKQKDKVYNKGTMKAL